ncbi:MAG: serine/threonine-protein kinase [Kofleriaceae bacterium]
MTDDTAPEPELAAFVAWLGGARGFHPGAQVGAFELVRLIGRGGMGEVWTADRVGADFAQRVAVKLLPGGNAATIARFRRERRILARLDHPNIAKLIDGGVTEGQPWLAMELVDGVPLTEWAKGKTLDQKLELFVQICDAVQFAHRNLVVHRDLKPTNILVTASGTAKLLDFGIAKYLAPDETDRDDLTRTHAQPMTPEYASPEQLCDEPVTIASDIWALGICLFELLSGERPYATTNASVDAAPVKVSRNHPELRGDLDAICMKALRGYPADRYPSVATFARDIRAHLDHAPVAARGDATSYLVRTMLRRHRAAVTVIGFAIILVIAGIASTVWQARRAHAHERQATRAFDLVVGMLGEFQPGQQIDQTLAQREILVRSEQRVGELDDDIDGQARLLEHIALVWHRSDESVRALPIAVRAMMLERMIDPHSMRFEALLDLAGNIELDLGAPLSALPLLAEARTIATAHHDDHALATAMNDLAAAMQETEHFDHADEMRTHALDLARTFDDPHQAVMIENDLAVLRGDEGKFAEARVLQAKACDDMRTTFGPMHPHTLTCRGNLALVDLLLENPKTALDEIDSVLADEEKMFGLHWHDRSRLLGLRQNALQQLGRYKEAMAANTEALAHAHPEDRAGILMQRAAMDLRDINSVDALNAAWEAFTCDPSEPCGNYGVKVTGRSRHDGLSFLRATGQSPR